MNIEQKLVEYLDRAESIIEAHAPDAVAFGLDVTLHAAVN